MSVKVSSWAWHDAGDEVMGNELVVLLALADVASDAGVCSFFEDPADMTQAALAKKARVSKSTLIRAVGRLVERGLVEVVKGRQHEPNGYRVLVPWVKSSGVSLTTLPESSDVNVTLLDVPELSSETSRGVKSSTRTSLKRIDVNMPTAAAVEQQRFDEFWAVYPRKVDKPKARIAFKAALKRASAEVIVSGAKAYRDDPGRDPQFTKYPQGWLSGDRWEAESLSGPVVEVPVVPDRLPAWVGVLGIAPEEFAQRHGELGWCEAMSVLAERRKAS